MVNFESELDAVVKGVYVKAFVACNYNQSKTAAALGVSRGTFRTKMKQWGLLK